MARGDLPSPPIRALRAAAETLPTPFFAIDVDRLRHCARDLRSAFGNLRLFFYTLKANAHPVVLRSLFTEGFGASISAAQELDDVEACGGAPLVFSGPALERPFAERLAHLDLRQISANTPGAMATAVRIAHRTNAEVLIRCRVSTDAKFGFTPDPERLDSCVTGLHVHGGTWDSGETWRAVLSAATLSSSMPIRNAGGGFAGPETLRERGETIADYAAALNSVAGDGPIAIEAGRFLVEAALFCVTTVLDVDGPRAFVDVGSNALPPLKRAAYRCGGLLDDSGTGPYVYDLYDRGCMPSTPIPPLRAGRRVHPGDRVLIENCGAYTYSLWSEFGAPRPRIVVIDGGQVACDT